jgi:hypothetical protein
MGNFTDQKMRVATAEECSARWGGVADGYLFRCYLCGHRFQAGDKWRWVYGCGNGVANFMTCDSCDGPDVLERWVARNEEAVRCFWWLMDVDDIRLGERNIRRKARKEE